MLQIVICERRRMMCKVIDHRHAVGHATHFKSALDAAKLGKRSESSRRRYTSVAGGNDGGECVHPVVLPGHCKLQRADDTIALMHC